MKHPIFIIAFIVVTVFAIYVALNGFLGSSLVDKDKFTRQYLPDEYYLKPVSFTSFDDKTRALSKNSQTTIPVELIRGKYISLFFKDKWNIERDEVTDSVNTIFASRKILDKSLTAFVIVTIIPNKNNGGANSVVVSYWED